MISQDTQKGFVYTLEAVIAATLFLGIVIVVIPDLQTSSPSRAAQDTVQTGLESLDKTSELEEMNRTEIENEVQDFVPPGYSHSVRISEVTTETHSVTSPGEFSFDREGDHFEIQFWISSANDLNASYGGEKLLDEYSSTGYELRTVEKGDGKLEFEGSGELVFEFDAYSYNGSVPDSENVRSINYVTGEREVQVFLWQE